MSPARGRLKLSSPTLKRRLKKVRLLVLDVDGIMTDGRTFYVEGQGWTRQFQIRDGYGIKLLLRNGIGVAAMSGSDSKDIRLRLKHLKIRHAYLGNEDKLESLARIAEATGVALDEMAYMGDDLFDIPVLEKVVFSATVPEALPAVRARVHYITETPGGMGAVREVADAIRAAQGLGPYV